MLWRVNTLKNSKVLVCGGRSHTEDIDHYFQKQPIGFFSCNREILSAKKPCTHYRENDGAAKNLYR